MIKVFIKNNQIIKTINGEYIGKEFEPEADLVIETEDFVIHQAIEYTDGALKEKVLERTEE